MPQTRVAPRHRIVLHFGDPYVNVNVNVIVSFEVPHKSATTTLPCRVSKRSAET